MSDSEQRTDACLIAAAPDLLAALESLDHAGKLHCPFYGQTQAMGRITKKQGAPCGECMFCRARAAIAKARGVDLR